MSKNSIDIYNGAYEEGFKFHDEDLLCLSWYARRIIKSIRDRAHIKTILSLGIGRKVVSRAIISRLGAELDKYTIVEGSSEIIQGLGVDENVDLVNSLFEDFEPECRYDAIEMGFVLEHVDDPGFIIDRYKKYLKADGVFFLAVPNAGSLHRRVGCYAGLMDNIHTLSEADLQLGHKRYFDLESFDNLVRESGLKIIKTEGVYLKPFSNSQLKSLDLSPEVVEALFELGVGRPEISNAIYMEATL